MAANIRWVVTFVNRGGARSLVDAAQGTYTYATSGEAEQRLDAMFGPDNPNGAARIRAIYGDNPQFAVRPVECWPGHNDPKTVWFD
jgi:hypothetical protein